MSGRSGRDDQSRKGTGLKTGVYKSKPEKNRTLENQGCGTRVGGTYSALLRPQNVELGTENFA
jgi:hypothetical protein